MFFEKMKALLGGKAGSRSLSHDIAELKELIRGEGKNEATSVEVFVQSFLAEENVGSKTKRQAVILLCALGIVLNEKVATVGHHERLLREVLNGCSQFEAGRLLASKEVMVIIKVIDNLIKKKVIAKELYSELATPFIELLQEDTKDEAVVPADNKKHGRWIHPSIFAAVGKSTDAELVEKDYTTYLCCHILDGMCEALNPNPPKEVILTAFDICHRALRATDADTARENVSVIACTCLWMAYMACEDHHFTEGVVDSILQVYTKTVSIVPLFYPKVALIETLKTNMEDFEGRIKSILGDFVPNPPLKKESSEFELCCKSLSASPEDAKSALKILCHRAYKYSPLCLTFDAVVVSLAALVIARGTTKTEVDSLALSFGVDSALILSACVSLGRYKTDSLKPLRARFEAEAAIAAAAAAPATGASKLTPTSFPEKSAQSAPYNPFLDVAKPDENETSLRHEKVPSEEEGNGHSWERREEVNGRKSGRDSRSRDRDRGRGRDRSRDRDRDRGRDRSRDRDRDRGRDRSRDRDRDRGRGDRSRERGSDRGRGDRSRETDRDRGRGDRSRGRDRDTGRDRSRDRDRDRGRGDGSRERDCDRGRERRDRSSEREQEDRGGRDERPRGSDRSERKAEKKREKKEKKDRKRSRDRSRDSRNREEMRR